jgi:hypothetical protein
MQVLRDNPELIGTSVGMLRRAASSLLFMAKLPATHPKFGRFQQRLLHFTMSHLMDSRVAATVAETLYELQKAGDTAPSTKANGENSVSNPAKSSTTDVSPSASDLKADVDPGGGTVDDCVHSIKVEIVSHSVKVEVVSGEEIEKVEESTLNSNVETSDIVEPSNASDMANEPAAVLLGDVPMVVKEESM